MSYDIDSVNDSREPMPSRGRIWKFSKIKLCWEWLHEPLINWLWKFDTKHDCALLHLTDYLTLLYLTALFTWLKFPWLGLALLYFTWPFINSLGQPLHLTLLTLLRLTWTLLDFTWLEFCLLDLWLNRLDSLISLHLTFTWLELSLTSLDLNFA